MTRQEFKEQIEGYDQIQNDIEVLRKYGFDHSLDRGKVARQIDLLHPKSIRLRVSAVLRETRTTKTLRMVAADGYLPPFQAGQYINLFVDVGGIRTSRPYSISSPPNQMGYWDVTVRQVEDGFVSNLLLNDVQAGDHFTCSAPTGNFYHNPLYQGKDVVYLAGGSGVTPFMSMIREVTDRGLDRRIHLIYGCRSEDDIIFQQELAERSRRHSNLSVSLVISDPSPECRRLTGFITAELIKRLVDDIPSKFYFLCGPEVMYSFCLGELEKLGMLRRKIRTEVFGPPADVTAKPGWPREIKGTAVFQVKVRGQQTLEARANEPLMNSLERNGLVLPSSCRSGECSLCRTKLLSGKVYQPPEVKLRYSDRIYGYIHPCLAYPLEDLEIMI